MTFELKTTPVDKRFATTNQANHCWCALARALNNAHFLPAGARILTKKRDVFATRLFSRCFRNRYNEWVMCLKKTDSDEDACKPMRQFAVISLAPGSF